MILVIIILEMLVSRLDLSVLWCRCSIVVSGASPAVYIQAELTESHLELMGHNLGIAEERETAPLARSGFTTGPAQRFARQRQPPVSLNAQADITARGKKKRMNSDEVLHVRMNLTWPTGIFSLALHEAR